MKIWTNERVNDNLGEHGSGSTKAHAGQRTTGSAAIRRSMFQMRTKWMCKSMRDRGLLAIIPDAVDKCPSSRRLATYESVFQPHRSQINPKSELHVECAVHRGHLFGSNLCSLMIPSSNSNLCSIGLVPI